MDQPPALESVAAPVEPLRPTRDGAKIGTAAKYPPRPHHRATQSLRFNQNRLSLRHRAAMIGSAWGRETDVCGSKISRLLRRPASGSVGLREGQRPGPAQHVFSASVWAGWLCEGAPMARKSRKKAGGDESDEW